MKRIAIVVSAVVLLPAGLAAQRGGADRTAVWKHLKETHDKDKDGQVTKAEYDRGDDKFARFDRDDDGVLTDADFEPGGRGNTRPANSAGRNAGGGNAGGGNAGGRSAASSRYIAMVGVDLAKQADTDHDGSIPVAEWKAYVASLRADADGVISSDALLGKGGSGRMAGMVLRSLDADGNGDITASDLQKAFELMDVDGDDTLQRSELGELPWPGEVAPDFELPIVGEDGKTLKLSSFKGKKPVALIFGSYT